MGMSTKYPYDRCFAKIRKVRDALHLWGRMTSEAISSSTMAEKQLNYLEDLPARDITLQVFRPTNRNKIVGKTYSLSIIV